MLTITYFFSQENEHFKCHKSWYILLCHPLCDTWFIISQKMQLSLKSSVILLWFYSDCVSFWSLAVWLIMRLKKKITLIRRRTLFTLKSLSLFIFLLFAVHFHQKPTPLQLATISQHSMTWWDTMRVDGIHTLGLIVLDNNVSTRSAWEWRDAPSFCYSVLNVSWLF